MTISSSARRPSPPTRSAHEPQMPRPSRSQRLIASAHVFTTAMAVTAATADPVLGTAAGMLASATSTDSGDIGLAAAAHAGTALGTNNVAAAAVFSLISLLALWRER